MKTSHFCTRLHAYHNNYYHGIARVTSTLCASELRGNIRWLLLIGTSIINHYYFDSL